MESKSSTNVYIPPLTLNDLERIKGKDTQQDIQADDIKNLSACPEKILQAEMNYIRAWRKERGDKDEQDGENLTGLALSGGGIRSATFSLGVMQALASQGLLKKIDYLSTVSGGGYIGSALTWLLSDKAYDDYLLSEDQYPLKEESAKKNRENKQDHSPYFGINAKDFPMGTDDPDPAESRHASEIQQRMLKYLRDHGYYLTPGSGINAFSLLGVVLRGTFLNVTMWMPVFILFFVMGLLLSGIYASDNLFILGQFEILKSRGGIDPELFGFELFLRLGLGLLIVLIVLTLLYSLLTWFRRQNLKDRLAGLWYQFRHIAERWSAVMLASTLLLFLIGSLPIIAAYLENWVSVGPMAMLSGIGIAMRDFLKPSGNSKKMSASILAPIAAGLFIFGGLLIAYMLARWIMVQQWLYLAVLVMIAFSLIFGWLVNLNYISIHRYYRDRLMETFMPDIDKALSNETGTAHGANVAKLHDFAYHEKAPRSPYHIVNTNVILADSKKWVYKNRGGDNFILSPLFCGSNATGWCCTKDFSGGKMTLATAVAISGAAANPNTGVGGVGLTRNRLVSSVMSLLSLGLGYWTEHPNPDRALLLKHTPNHIHPGLYDFGNFIDFKGFDENRAFLQLSDGGHFENMGVYELIRRRLKLIIVCDGGADGDFSFSDFQTTVRRIEDDFGARIKVLDSASPDEVVPVSALPGEAVYPKNARYAKQGFMVGHIIYADDTEGWMIFLKTTMIKEVSFKVKGYAAQNKDFPDQSTIDQFFDEVQFEAYRELGYRLTKEMLNSDIPKDMICEQPSSTRKKSSKKFAEFINTCNA